MERKSLLFLCFASLLAGAFSITINDNLTVVVEEWNSQSVTLPLVEKIIWQCSDRSVVNITWKYSGNNGNCTEIEGTEDQKCSPTSMASSSVSCTFGADNTTFAVNVTINDDLVVFVNETFYYKTQRLNKYLPLGKDAEPSNVRQTIPCIPVGKSDNQQVSARWTFKQRTNAPSLNIMTGPFMDATASFTPIQGNSGSITDGMLTLSRSTRAVAGHYECSVASNSSDIATLYWGPVFDDYNFVNASAIEGQNVVMHCDGQVHPGYPVMWERCAGNGEDCFGFCNNIVNLTSGGRYQPGLDPRRSNLYPPSNTLIIYGAQMDDRGCYRCTVTNSVQSRTHYIFLRIRDDLAVMWPILGLIIEVMIVILCILAHNIYQRWKKKQKPPVRSTSGPDSDLNTLLPDETVSINRSPSEANDTQMRKRMDMGSTSTATASREYKSSDV